jgi:hypothetical protein
VLVDCCSVFSLDFLVAVHNYPLVRRGNRTRISQANADSAPSSPHTLVSPRRHVPSEELASHQPTEQLGPEPLTKPQPPSHPWHTRVTVATLPMFARLHASRMHYAARRTWREGLLHLCATRGFEPRLMAPRNEHALPPYTRVTVAALISFSHTDMKE